MQNASSAPITLVQDAREAAVATARSWRDMLDRRSLLPNLSAGLTVALVAIPLNLALALACGLPPGVGLVTGAIAGLLGAFFGGAKLQITGPEVALAPICVEIVSRYGFEGLIAATFLAGCMQVGFGALRIGGLIHSIPVPVIGGFLAAVGLLVFDAQLPRLLGLPGEIRLLTDIESLDVLGQTSIASVGVGLLVIALFVGLPKISRAIPAPLLAVCAAVAAMQIGDLGLPTVPAIESVMPSFGLPRFGNVDLHALWPEALALALLASIDSLLCAVAVQARTGGDRVRTDQELVAQGLANMLSACFGGMPVAAAVVRSIAAVEAGASTRLAPVVQSVILGFVLLVLAPFVSLLPLVALGGLLLVVGARLVDLRGLFSMWKVARFEALVFVGTALGILLTDFVLGVGIGVVAALVHFARQQRAAVRTFGRARGLRFEGPLFFGSQASIEAAVRDAIDGDRVIIDVSAVSSVDYSGAMALAKALERVAKDGTRVSIYVGAHVAPALRFFLDECRAEGLEVVEPLDVVSRPSLQAALRTEDRRTGDDRRLSLHEGASISTT